MAWPTEKVYAFYKTMRSKAHPVLEEIDYPVYAEGETRNDGCVYASSFDEPSGRTLYFEVYDFDQHMKYYRNMSRKNGE